MLSTWWITLWIRGYLDLPSYAMLAPGWARCATSANHCQWLFYLEEALVNKGLSIGLAVLGVLLVIFAPIEHYIVRIKMQHLASGIFGLGVALLVLGIGLLVLGRRSAAA
jgi:hypothetical protein